VGITPRCPYGLSACWGGAREALGLLEGVGSVARTPYRDDCTAQVSISENRLPELDKWRGQFKSVVGDVYQFRGVEVTIVASLDTEAGRLVLRAGQEKPVILAPLKHKLQWDFEHRRPRPCTAAERKAYKHLAAETTEAKSRPLKVRVTGPLKTMNKRYLLEVREFSLLTTGTAP